MDTYFRKPSEMRDYLVNWRNYAFWALIFTGNALAFTQNEDINKYYETHATIGIRTRGRFWEYDSAHH